MTPVAQPPSPVRRPATADLIRLLRPAHWTKNLFVGAALVFAFGDQTRARALSLGDLGLMLPAMLLFCLVSSGVYAMNDWRDRERDRRHPVKRFRPVASGAVPASTAAGIAVGLIAVALALSFALSQAFGAVVGGYVALQVLYTLWLRRVALIDIMVIAAGFVLRAMAGAMVMPGIVISPWLLICTFMLALFLALCKRRNEKGDEPDGRGHRASLRDYDARLLDQLIAVIAAATIVSYAVYTQWPETVAKYGTPALGFTVPFVVFGVFRYLDLVYRHARGGRPERVLLTDIPTLVNIAAYGLTVATILALGRLA